MATAAPRQLGRRGTSNGVSSDSGIALSPTSTTSTMTPPRRYVLDVPTDRTSRGGRGSTTKTNELYDETTARSRTDINNENGEQLSRSTSREYYYRDSGNESSLGVGRYYEDPSIRQLIDSGSGEYTNTLQEDEEVRTLTAQATPEVRNYPINIDPNPELIVRPNTQRLTYKQDIAVRYLKPNTPPPPGPIIIREIRAPPPPAAPPIVLRQRPPPPRTPSPVIIRERPPPRPKSVPTTIIKKIIPPPPAPPRKLIIERFPKLPPKPRPVIIERWLPYHRQRRQVIHEKAKPLEPRTPIKNTIIEWRPPEVEVVKHVKKLGVQEADPQQYYTQHGDRLYATDFVQRKLNELGLQEEIALMAEQQRSVSQEHLAMEQADETNVRQILNSQSSSSRRTYDSSSISRLVHATGPGYFDEQSDQQVYYGNSPTNSTSMIYTSDGGYVRDDYPSNAPVLTEEMLLRSYSNNSGQFPTHLLKHLGSQVYDIPSDQLEVANNGRRTTTTTTTRYYTVNQGEPSYEPAVEEVIATAPRYNEEKYVQIRESDLREVMNNYNEYRDQPNQGQEE